MLVLDPEVVRFEDVVFEDALGVAVDRQAKKLVEEWGDDGPHAALVDVPEQRVLVRVTRRPARGRVAAGADAEAGLTLGREGDLVFYSSTEGGGARTRFVVRCVLTSVRTELSIDAAGRPSSRTAPGLVAVQTLTFVGVSRDGGSADPIQVEASPV
ncbi:MAG: hypothetical protein K2Q20_02515 [Phycisphaerales bacterium]|nr:hypothetical protein [Phycisphaerales bacterium]